MSKNKNAKKVFQETYTTQSLSRVFYFGPQEKGDESKSDLNFSDFIEDKQALNCKDNNNNNNNKNKDNNNNSNKKIPKNFSESYHPTMKRDQQFIKLYENDSILISDSESMTTVDFYQRYEKLTFWERRMMEISNAIRNKPDWQKKINDPVIVERWVREINEQTENNLKRANKFLDIPVIKSVKIMKRVLEELRFLATLGNPSCQVSSVSGVWQTDALVSDEILEKLKERVKELEDVPDWRKDWHPNTDNMVLDLVHPSLYCWVNGETALYYPQSLSCKKYIVDIKTDGSRSRQYQWLPSDFHVDEKGKVSILSYINNLDPSIHRPLYDTIGKVFEKFVPLFEKVLGQVTTDFSENRQQGEAEVQRWKRFLERELIKKMQEDGKRRRDRIAEEELHAPQLRRGKPPPKPPIGGPEPVIRSFVKYAIEDYNLKNRTLQVIVKLANIELTPNKPKYKGGSWHIEGMRNEDIVASGIYYYHSENISESILNFRVASTFKFTHDDDTPRNAIYQVYGMEEPDALNDSLGGLITKSGRAIAFPNLYQHLVAPFELRDKTKIGSRKILVFFLVDPNKRILSTTNVPPQQKSWALRELAPIFHTLPRNVLTQIVSYLPLMDLKEAHHHRKELMEERSAFVTNNTYTVYEQQFNMCEH